MAKKHQMRWDLQTIQPFLDVRVHVLNAKLEDAFRHWPRGFCPPVDLLLLLDHPTTLHALYIVE